MQANNEITNKNIGKMQENNETTNKNIDKLQENNETTNKNIDKMQENNETTNENIGQINKSIEKQIGKTINALQNNQRLAENQSKPLSNKWKHWKTNKTTGTIANSTPM